MNLVKTLISEDLYPIKSPYTMTPEFVVIHNTANTVSAVDEIAYMKKNTYEVSYHYAVDDTGAYQAIPENRNAWHAGDGASGEGNRKGISIEICYSKTGGELFAKSEANTAELVADILNRYGWGIDKVKKHKDFSATSCPHRTLKLGWDRFLDMVRAELIKLQSKEDDTMKTVYTVSVALTNEKHAKAVAKELTSMGLVPTVYTIDVNSEYKEESKPTPAPAPTFKVGSNVKIKQGAKTYTGGGLASFVYTRVHQIIQLEGDRAVIAYKGATVAAVNTKDLTQA